MAFSSLWPVPFFIHEKMKDKVVTGKVKDKVVTNYDNGHFFSVKIRISHVVNCSKALSKCEKNKDTSC